MPALPLQMRVSLLQAVVAACRTADVVAVRRVQQRNRRVRSEGGLGSMNWSGRRLPGVNARAAGDTKRVDAAR